MTDLSSNFENIPEDMVEKMDDKDSKIAVLMSQWSFQRGLPYSMTLNYKDMRQQDQVQNLK